MQKASPETRRLSFRAEVLDGANMSFVKVLGYVNGRQGRNIFAGCCNHVVPIIGQGLMAGRGFSVPSTGQVIRFARRTL